MKFSYLLIADAANVSPNGKVNILGAGVRIMHAPALPVASNVAIVGSVLASLDELGPHTLEVWIEGPEGHVQLVKDSVSIGDVDVEDRELPATLNFQINSTLRFRTAGIRVLHARYGRARAQWPFSVRLVEEQSEDAAQSQGE